MGLDGRQHSVYVALDHWANRSFVTYDLISRLGLSYSEVNCQLSTMDNVKQDKKMGVTTIQLGPLIKPFDVYVVQRICNDVCDVPFNPQEVWPQLSPLTLADSYPRPQVAVDVLLGLDVLKWVVNGMTKLGSEGPFVMDTIFGWVLFGDLDVSKQYASSEVYSMATIMYSEERSLVATMERFSSLEAIGITPHGEEPVLSPEDRHALQVFKDTCVFRDGHYEVPLIFKPNAPALLNNKKSALGRLFALEGRLLKEPELGAKYQKGIEALLTLRFAEKVPENELSRDNVFYLPHRPVVDEERESTNLRIVMDASAQGPKGVSLNDCLVTGPPKQPDSTQMLLRLREKPVAIQGDISKMFLQIMITQEHRDLLRFLWRDLDQTKPPQEYRMLVTTFGVKESPFKAIECVRQHALKYMDTHARTVKELLTNLYMDDLLTGAETEDEALQIINEVNSIMKEGGFTFQKWASNSKKVLQGIPEELRSRAAKVEFNEQEQEHSHTALGLDWDISKDVLSFKPGKWTEEKTHTKRTVLSSVAKLFDPLGLISPLIIKAKIIMQQLWKAGIDWDDELPEDLKQEWESWLSSVDKIEEIKIPRCIRKRKIKSQHLHAFGDASKEAYGAALYLVCTYDDGSTSANLVMSKTRVAPIKESGRIPRLELLAALLAARLVTYYKEATGFNGRVTCWTDSTCVWHWLQRSSSD